MTHMFDGSGFVFFCARNYKRTFLNLKILYNYTKLYIFFIYENRLYQMTDGNRKSRIIMFRSKQTPYYPPNLPGEQRDIYICKNVHLPFYFKFYIAYKIIFSEIILPDNHSNNLGSVHRTKTIKLTRSKPI